MPSGTVSYTKSDKFSITRIIVFGFGLFAAVVCASVAVAASVFAAVVVAAAAAFFVVTVYAVFTAAAISLVLVLCYIVPFYCWL